MTYTRRLLDCITALRSFVKHETQCPCSHYHYCAMTIDLRCTCGLDDVLRGVEATVREVEKAKP